MQQLGQRVEVKTPRRPSPAMIFIGLLLAAGLFAQGLAAQQQPDVRLVVDISGSMKQNDPNNLRQPAVELLTQLLPPNSKAGVWTFGQYVNMLVPHRPVNDEWARQAAGKSGDINSVGLFTNIGDALDKATYDRDQDNSDYNTSVILLTDGMVDVSKDPGANQQEWRRIVEEVVPALAAANIRVHTIALSDKADSRLLNKIALATGGKAAVAKTADELMKAFLAAFDQAAPAEQLPLEGDRFAVDSSVEEFTALIFRESKVKPTVLLGPDQTRYQQASAQSDPDLNWHAGIDYDLITLQRPLEGEWVVTTGIAPDSRVTVVSNLNLVVKPMPANLYRGQMLPLDVRLQEEGKTITDANFLRLLDISAVTTRQSERRQESLSAGGVPANGIYRARLDHFNELGQYQVTVALDGKSFQRQITHSVDVRDAFSVEVRPGPQPGMPYEVHAIPYAQNINLQQSSVIARITSPSGQTAILPVPLTQVDDWLLKYSPVEEGLYQVSLAIDVTERNGNAYQYQHPTIEFAFPEGKTIAPKPVAEPEPTPEPEAEPKAKKSGTPWWVYVALGVGNLLIFGLAFLAYKLIMGGSKDLEDDDVEPESKEPSAKEEAETKKAPAEPLAMADIADEELDEVSPPPELPEATDLSSDDALAEDIPMDDGDSDPPEAPIDDLDAMLAEATGGLPEADSDDDDDDAEFSLDDFASDDDDKK